MNINDFIAEVGTPLISKRFPNQESLSAVLIAEAYRETEFKSIGDRLRKTDSRWNIDYDLYNDRCADEVFSLLNRVRSADLVVVSESASGKKIGDQEIRHPLALTSSSILGSFSNSFSAINIIENRGIVFTQSMAAIVYVALDHNRHVLIIPGCPDCYETYSYVPPSCWLDLLTADDVKFYTGT